MFTPIRKAMLISLGLAVMGKEKLEELSNELKKRGIIPEKTGKEFVDDIISKAEREEKELANKFQKAIKDTLAKMNLPSKTDIDQLRKEIKKLEKKIESTKVKENE